MSEIDFLTVAGQCLVFTDIGSEIVFCIFSNKTVSLLSRLLYFFTDHSTFCYWFKLILKKILIFFCGFREIDQFKVMVFKVLV